MTDHFSILFKLLYQAKDCEMIQAALEKGLEFKETILVSKNGLIISEMIIPRPLEILQSIVLYLLRRMPTYVFSRRTLLEAVANCHLQASEIREYRFTNFVKPFKLFSPIIDFPWLKVPAFIIPFRYLYLVVKKPSESTD